MNAFVPIHRTVFPRFMLVARKPGIDFVTVTMIRFRQRELVYQLEKRRLAPVADLEENHRRTVQFLDHGGPDPHAVAVGSRPRADVSPHPFDRLRTSLVERDVADWMSFEGGDPLRDDINRPLGFFLSQE